MFSPYIIVNLTFLVRKQHFKLFHTFFCWTHRSDADTVLTGDTVQASGVKRSEDTQEQRTLLLKIIPYRSGDKHLNMDAVKDR